MTSIDEQGTPADERPSTARMVFHFFAGFVVAQILCAGGLFLLAMTLDPINSMGADFKLPMRIAVAGFTVAVVFGALVGAALLRRRFPLLLPGSIVGTVLGMLALGPCAFCYVALDL